MRCTSGFWHGESGKSVVALATTTEIYPGFAECVNSDARRFTQSFLITQANLICTQSANVASFLTLVVYVQSLVGDILLVTLC